MATVEITPDHIKDLKNLIACVPTKPGDTGAILAKQVLFYILAQSSLLERTVVVKLGKQHGTIEELESARRYMCRYLMHNLYKRMHFCLGCHMVLSTGVDEKGQYLFFLRPAGMQYGQFHVMCPSSPTRGDLDTIDVSPI